MRTHWLIQMTGLRRPDALTAKLIEGLERAGCTWSDIGVIPFTNEITNWQAIPDESVFVHCSTKVLEIFSDPSIKPTEIFAGAGLLEAYKLYDVMKRGLFYNKDRFDQTKYSQVNTAQGKLYAELVNGDCQVYSLRDALNRAFSHDRFVKPGADLKLFSGVLLPANTPLREALAKQTVSSKLEESMDELVIFADVRKLLAEWRFFVIGGQVVTGSQYRRYDALLSSAYIPEYVRAHAQDLANRYHPAPAFVMDLALTNDLELQIMEYNCVNCSGLYDSNVEELAKAISLL